MITLHTRIHKFPLTLFFLVSFYMLQAQDLELATYYHQRIEGKEFSFQEKERILDSLLDLNNIRVDTLKLVKIYRSFVKGINYSDVRKSIRYTEKITKIATLLNSFETDDFKVNHRNRISLLFADQQYYKGLKCGFEYLKKYPKTDKSLGKVYRLIANIYSEIGDLQKSVDNYDKAIFIFKKQNNSKELAKSYISKLETYVSLEDNFYSNEITQIIIKLNLLEETYDFLPNDRTKKDLNIGYFYEFSGNYKKAKLNYLRVLETSIKEEAFDIVFKTYINLGIVSIGENNLKDAKNYFIKASKYVYENKSRLASVSNNLAEVFKKENNHKEAIIHYQKAITQALQSKELDYQTLPSFQDIELSPNKLDILGYLIDKANGWIAYYDAEQNPEHLQNALETFTLADELIDIIYVESREDLSKLFWRKKSATFYPKAVEVCYRLKQPEKAFSFMEKNKAMLLLENMTNATAKRLSKLPENVLEREQNLIKEIKTLEAEIQASATDNQILDSLKNSVFKYKKEYNSFVDSLETNYPKYYNYKKNINIVTLQEVQKNLQENELVLQYIVGKEKGFVALISPKAIKLEALPNTEILTKTVETYKESVSKPFVNKKDKKTYQTVAKKLYQQLIPFKESNALFQKRVTIIADGMLQYIPFEALLTPDNEYLIKTVGIHYNYSLSSAAQSKQNKVPISKMFIAIAPTKFKNNAYGKLTTSSAELKKLSNIFDANHFQYENATKQRFTEAYGNYKIIHLSTHGGIDNTVPWMAFYDEKMTLDELYFTKNQSELVVLSACKTSDGELKKGEGVMSLARGFFNAGAKSVVSSLWDINEKASNDIIQEFYKNLAKGDSKSRALQKAKLTYIKNNGNTSEASPYYWSALTITGDITPIYDNPKTYLYYIFGGLLLVGILLFVNARRKKKQV